MKVLCFGSLNLDYVFEVPYFVRPAETLASLSRRINPGGKGVNQSIAAAKAGCRVYHAGKIGADGSVLVEKLNQAGVDTCFVRFSDKGSGNAIIQVNQKGENSIILYPGANHDIDDELIREVIDSFDKGDLILLQNEINSVDTIMKYAYEKGMKIAFNPSPFSKEIFDYPLGLADFLFINEIEGEELTSEAQPESIIRAMLKKYPEAKIILTLGDKGAFYADGSQIISQKIYPVEVRDTTGAGDTFTGYFIYGITKGMPIPDIMDLASRAAAVCVSREGAAESVPSLQEVMEYDFSKRIRQ